MLPTDASFYLSTLNTRGKSWGIATNIAIWALNSQIFSCFWVFLVGTLGMKSFRMQLPGNVPPVKATGLRCTPARRNPGIIVRLWTCTTQSLTNWTILSQHMWNYPQNLGRITDGASMRSWKRCSLLRFLHSRTPRKNVYCNVRCHFIQCTIIHVSLFSYW